jgi:hypothetical protein
MLPKVGRGLWSAYLMLSVRADPTLLCRSTFRDFWGSDVALEWFALLFPVADSMRTRDTFSTTAPDRTGSRYRMNSVAMRFAKVS